MLADPLSATTPLPASFEALFTHREHAAQPGRRVGVVGVKVGSMSLARTASALQLLLAARRAARVAEHAAEQRTTPARGGGHRA